MTSESIGFMQGRLSEPVNGKIQAFPWGHWRDEFEIAQACGFSLMEWTLDYDRLTENPIMTHDGRKEICALSRQYGVSILSLTGDCFMQAPFFKESGDIRITLLDEFKKVIEACDELGVRYIVFPLVDNGSLENEKQEDELIDGLEEITPLLHSGVKVIFESDYPPIQLRKFIDRLPGAYFGINYDTGNSSALGFDPVDEISIYGDRICNVHIKDRVLYGTTVPLGTGNANFPIIFKELKKKSYKGNFILQTARATDRDHVGVLLNYREMVRNWIDGA